VLKPVALVALAITVLAMFAAYVADVSGLALPVAITVALVVIFIASFLPRQGVVWLDDLVQALRAFLWRREQGRYHSHAGVPVQVHDDGRHVWINGDALQRILGSHDSEEVLAARHAGHWRRFEDGVLMLRADAVVRHLATAPGRLDPRIVRLRRWLEREVLFPAAERRRRSA
jgi:hypothetical protein